MIIKQCITRTSIGRVHLQVVQNWPDHPGEQLHILGAEHVPPLKQSGLQIALRYEQYNYPGANMPTGSAFLASPARWAITCIRG